MVFLIDLGYYEMEHLHFKVFLTIYMHQFGLLSERGGNFLNLLQKEEGTQKRGGFQFWRKLCSPIESSHNLHQNGANLQTHPPVFE